MHFIDASETRGALAFDRLIPALRRMFAAGCEVPARHIHRIGPDGDDATLTSLIMPAWQPGGCYGIKVVNVAPHNRAAGRPALFSTYLLYDAGSGEPLAQIDGNEITCRRTAAASALAAGYLARPDARRLLVVGSGQVARRLPEAFRAVLPIEAVRVWNVRPDGARRLARELAEGGFAAEAATDLEAAVRWADVTSCATLATAPLVHGAWLPEGSHLDLVGSFTPAMREADDAAFSRAAVYIDTPEALQKSGDLLGPLARGAFRAEDVRGLLSDLCTGDGPARRLAGERTVFKAVGTALEDLAAARLVYEARASAAAIMFRGV